MEDTTPTGLPGPRPGHESRGIGEVREMEVPTTVVSQGQPGALESRPDGRPEAVGEETTRTGMG